MAKESDKKKEPTPKEIAAERAKLRESALATLKTGLVNYAATFYINQTPKDKAHPYGEAVASAVDEYIYIPTLRSKEGSELIADTLISSRKNGRRYSGNLSEEAILEGSAQAVQEALANITVEDAYRLMGSKEKIRKNLAGVYIGDLLASKDKETKEFGETVFNTYLSNLADNKASEALQARPKARLKGLEELVKPEGNAVSKLWDKVTGKK